MILYYLIIQEISKSFILVLLLVRIVVKELILSEGEVGTKEVRFISVRENLFGLLSLAHEVDAENSIVRLLEIREVLHERVMSDIIGLAESN